MTEAKLSHANEAPPKSKSVSIDVEDAVVKFNELWVRQQRLGKYHLPTVVGVGAGRCGTTTVYNYLRHHPDVYMSPIKEINYFGVRSRGPARPRGLTLEDYALFFSGRQKQRHVGEISPIYLSQPEAAEEIKSLLRHCRIIVQIRHPVARFASQYKHHLRQHNFDDMETYVNTALEGLGKQSPRLARDWYNPAKNMLQSLYAEQLRKYISLFGRQNVHVMVFDDMVAKPQAAASALCAFLQIAEGEYAFRITNRSAGDLPAGDGWVARLSEVFREDIERTEEILGRKLWSDKAYVPDAF